MVFCVYLPYEIDSFFAIVSFLFIILLYMKDFLFTSESVSEGHPDKVADQVSDAILDAILDQDPNARVAEETMAATNLLVLAGEITSNSKVDYKKIARNTLRNIGYDNPDYGIDYKLSLIHI